MGKAIVYCQTCGQSLREEDFDRGKAFKVENQNYCVKCRPKQATPPPTPAPRREISTKIPVIRPEVPKPASTPRMQQTPTPPRRNLLLLWIAIGVVGVVGGLATVVALRRDETSVERPPPVVTPPKQPLPKAPEFAPFERDLALLRGHLREPLKNWKTREIDALLRTLSQYEGPRREEIEKMKADFERGLRTLDLREGLLGRWTLDEKDGTVAHDSSGNGNDGRIMGSPGRVPGRFGGGFQFRSAEDYVEIAPAGALGIKYAACFTLCAWFLPDSLPPAKPAIANDNEYGIFMRSGYHIGLSLSSAGRVEMRSWLIGGKKSVHFPPDNIAPNVWSHLAGIVDPRSGRTKLFINGKPTGETAWAPKSAIYPLESPWRIGIAEPKSKDIIWSARGVVDEVLFYGRVLSPEEIAMLAEGAVPPDSDPRRYDPSDADLVLHLRADRDVKQEGSAVAAWSDAARGIDATSAVKEERPTLALIDGQATLKFDGKNDRLAIAARPALAFQETDSFTLAVRVHLTTVPAKARWQGLVEKSLEAGPWYGFWIDDKNRWVFGSTQNLHGSQVKAGFTQLVGVQEGGKEQRFYVDGWRVATGPAMAGSGPGLLWIGGSNGRPEFFEGEIQEVRLWRRALDPAEVRGLSK